MATINPNGTLPVFNSPQEMLAYLYQNNMLPQNQLQNINPTAPLDWATTNQLIPSNNTTTNPQTSLTSQPTISLTDAQVADDSFTNNAFTDPELLARMQSNQQVNAYDDNGNPITTSTQSTNYQAPFQFFNPYGGFDLPSATFKLGQSIEDGNTLGTVASGLKVGASLARNFLGGLAYNRRNNQIQEDYRNNQRRYLTQVNNPVIMEDGGEMSQPPQNEEQELIQEIGTALQNGEDPQVILQTLLEMGVDEQTAQGMIDFVMQQLQGQTQPEQANPMMEQGGTFFAELKGKRIKNYEFNPETGNYEVEYE